MIEEIGVNAECRKMPVAVLDGMLPESLDADGVARC
jgi:hypothetical protein